MKVYSQFINYIVSCVPKYILFASVEKAEVCLVGHHDSIHLLLLFMKKHTASLLNMLVDITAVDYPQKSLRFEVVYLCLSTKYAYRLRLKTSVNELMALASVHNLYLSSNWSEREVWDMFGIFYHNHSRLRRIMTDYGFVGYPLRKDFPCMGFQEVRFSESQQKVVYEPLELSCAMRFV